VHPREPCVVDGAEELVQRGGARVVRLHHLPGGLLDEVAVIVAVIVRRSRSFVTVSPDRTTPVRV
jgi:hypothetical protein